jgi:serine/threonine-protein kinase
MALMSKRATTLPGIDAVREEVSGPELVMEVTVETSAPERVLPRIEEIKAENLLPEASVPIRRSPRGGGPIIWAVVCLGLLGAAGALLFVHSDKPSAAPKRAEAVEARPAAPVASKPVVAKTPDPPAPTAPARPVSSRRSATPAAAPDKGEDAPATQASDDGDDADEAGEGAPDKPVKGGPPRRRNATALYEEGTSLFVQGKAAAAKQKFKEAIAISPNHAPSFRGLGMAYQALGQKAKAAAALERYLRLAPSAGDAEQIRARLEKLKP